VAHETYNRAMYIIVIGWLYITVLMAATERSLVAGFLTLFFYGLAPVALFVWIFGTSGRRRERIAAARSRLPQQPGKTGSADEVVGDVVGDEDGRHAQRDQ
jgi:hypothetical protein